MKICRRIFTLALVLLPLQAMIVPLTASEQPEGYRSKRGREEASKRQSGGKKRKLSLGAKIGIGVGVTVPVLAAIAFAAWKAKHRPVSLATPSSSGLRPFGEPVTRMDGVGAFERSLQLTSARDLATFIGTPCHAQCLEMSVAYTDATGLVTKKYDCVDFQKRQDGKFVANVELGFPVPNRGFSFLVDHITFDPQVNNPVQRFEVAGMRRSDTGNRVHHSFFLQYDITTGKFTPEPGSFARVVQACGLGSAASQGQRALAVPAVAPQITPSMLPGAPTPPAQPVRVAFPVAGPVVPVSTSKAPAYSKVEIFDRSAFRSAGIAALVSSCRIADGDGNNTFSIAFQNGGSFQILEFKKASDAKWKNILEFNLSLQLEGESPYILRVTQLCFDPASKRLEGTAGIAKEAGQVSMDLGFSVPMSFDSRSFAIYLNSEQLARVREVIRSWASK